MEFWRPVNWADALAAMADRPDVVPIAGGTDVMVDVNFDRARPGVLLDLTGLGELTGWDTVDGRLRVGAGVPYSVLIDRLGGSLPGLALAARTVGSPQIRNRGTVGGNLGSASPAGDAHPPLLADDALVELASVRGSRLVPVAEYFTGPKRSVRAADELVAAFHMAPADGPRQFAKVGTRNAMVIAVCAFALALRPGTRTVGTGIGSAGPTPLRAREAETFLAGELESCGAWTHGRPPSEAAVTRFAGLVAEAASPIDDVRGTSAYRRHALSVLARRTFTWTWQEYRTGGAACA